MGQGSILYKRGKGIGIEIASMMFYFITPFAFVFSPLLFILCVVTQLILQMCQGYNFSELFIIVLLNGFLYSSVSIAGLRFYDWIIITSFIFIFIERRGHIAILVRLIFFGMAILFVFLFHGMKNDEVLEVVRYAVSILLIIIILNTRPKIRYISKEIIRLCEVNLYNAIAVFTFVRLGRVHNYTSSIVSTNVYIFTDEMRLNGFFSDPNKYMTFCLALLFLVELFIKDQSCKKKGILILSISTVLSMSRTALLCLALFYLLKYALKLKKKSAAFFWSGVIVAGMALMVIVASPSLINRITNELYTFAAKVLGREHTLEINATVQDDNRVYVWKKAVEFISCKPFFGNGWLAYESLLPYPTHNTIISLLLDGGVFILTAYIYTFWPLLSAKRFDITIPCVIFPMLLLDLGNYRVLFFLLALVMLQINKEIE